jgi:rod shape-determining protein MreC
MRGMAVVTPDGIVGRVLASYPTASQVLLITDSTFAAGVISERNRVRGTLKGVGQNKCIVDYVQNEEKVDVGEVFYTSGDDRVFPKGLPVGTVTVVRPGKTFKEIYVVPSGTQNGLEEVLVVMEGIHQEIPDASAVPSNDIYIMPPPPTDKSASSPTSDQPGSNLTTDADRMRDRYKRIGIAQGHVFGTGTPGGKYPNFNQSPDEAKPAVPKPPATGAAVPPITATPRPQTAPNPTAPAVKPGASLTEAPVKPPAQTTGTATGAPNPLAIRPQQTNANPAGAPVKPPSSTGTVTVTPKPVPPKPVKPAVPAQSTQAPPNP